MTPKLTDNSKSRCYSAYGLKRISSIAETVKLNWLQTSPKHTCLLTDLWACVRLVTWRALIE